LVCRRYETDTKDEHTVVNPCLLVEITSESTEEYGRGERLERYRRIPSLDASVRVSYREELLEVF
jgi:Uma2 family endonuclease